MIWRAPIGPRSGKPHFLVKQDKVFSSMSGPCIPEETGPLQTMKTMQNLGNF